MRASYRVALCALTVTLGCGDDGKSTKEATDQDAGQRKPPSTQPDSGGSGAIEAGPDSAADPCAPLPTFDTITQHGVDKVDVLFVIDNSPSMQEEQANLAAQLPRLVKTLASGKLTDKAGSVVAQFAPVDSLHLGVVSSNMGINGTAVVAGLDACKDFGDDGLLLNKADTSLPECDRAFPSYLDFPDDSKDPEALGASFGCVARTGAGGCGFEQQLEAALKAVAPKSNASFSRGTTGHGDGENAGFLRQDSVLMVIEVSDEEDSSIPDSSKALFDVTTGDNKRLNIRQYLSPELLHPAGRFVDGLKALRPENPALVIFGAIVGVPLEAESLYAGDIQDFDAILGLKSMQFREAEPSTNGTILPEPACTSASGTAYPARRFVEVAKGFGRNGVVRSICSDDFSGALDAVVQKLATQLTGACFDEAVTRDSEGRIDCEVIEVLAVDDKTGCDASLGRTPADPDHITGPDGKQRKVCKVHQVAVELDRKACESAGETNPEDCLARSNDGTAGWYYDDFSAHLRECTQQIGFTAGAPLRKGAHAQFSCGRTRSCDPKDPRSDSCPDDYSCRSGQCISDACKP